MPRPVPEPVPAPAPPNVGEAPRELVERIRRDAAKRAGVDPAKLRVIRDEAVTWPDGSLGCAEPGREYLMALVPGYWVVLALGDREFDYRSDATGHFMLCVHGRGRAPAGQPPTK